MQLLEETWAVLSLGKLCSQHGCSYEWKNGETPCIIDNFVPLVVPGLSSSSSSSSSSTSRPKDQSTSSGESEASTDPISQIRKVTHKKRMHCVHAFYHKNKKRSILRSEKYGDLTTAEHKILSEGCESRNNHQYAVVVQVLATQWNPCQTKTSQETEKNLRKFLQPSQKPKVVHTYNL